MKKKMKRVGIVTGLCAVALCAGAYKCIEVGASDTAELWDGFAITATAVRTQDPVGLRFKTDVERLTPTMKKYNPDAEYYTVLTLTTGGKEYTTTRYADVWRPDGSGWNTVLLGIPESDYETKVTAQSFVKLNGKETAVYQTEAVTISISQVAAAAMSYGATSEYITQYVDEIVTGITLDQTSASIEVGQTVGLTATTTPSGYMAKWTSSDTSVATVDNKGNVKAKAVGTVTITAEINGYTASCQVTVNARTETLTGFASSVSLKSGYLTAPDRTVIISGTWLNQTFADERIDGLTFDMTSTKAMNLTAFAGAYQLSLSTNLAKRMTITRSMYEAWQKTGESNIVLTSDLSRYSSATISLSNFQKVWAEDESETLTQAEITALGLTTPYEDYQYNSHQMSFYGYGGVRSDTWKEYDPATGEVITVTSEEDYRSVYRIEEYKDAGFTILMPQSSCAVMPNSGFVFATSKLKEVMDMALEAEMQKVIVSDYRLYELVIEDSIVGDGKKFATEADLDAQITAWMKDYAVHEAFYGVQLPDEPLYTKLVAYGQVYRSIKRCFPNAFIQANLHPTGSDTVIENGVMPSPSQTTLAKYSGYGSYQTCFAAFDEYLNMYLDNTGADYIMYDAYPLTNSGVAGQYVGMMQVAANIAKARNVDLRFVSQTMTLVKPLTGTNDRILTEADLRWLNNMSLSFGIKELAYYTYYTKGASQYERGLDGGSLINNAGEKTDLYYFIREILAENQKFAPVLMSFDYQSSATYTSNNTVLTSGYATAVTGNITKLQSVEVDAESTLITQLYDKTHKRYMYAVQNLIDPTSATGTQTVKLVFDESYQYALVYKNGEKSVVKLENNTYVVKQTAGEAVYVIPFNDQDSSGVATDVNQGDTLVQFPTDDNDDGWTKSEIYSDAATGDSIVWFPGVDEDRMPWDEITE